LFERTPQESDPVTLARRYLDGADIVLVEGFKRAPLPKIEVYRLAAGPDPIFDAKAHDPGDWVAMVTDHPRYRAEFPVFRFSDTSAMDGYATRAADVGGATADRPVPLNVIETVPAGRFPAKAVGAGEAIRIFTGAPLPAGADTVIRQEDTEPLAGDRVAVRDGRDARKNIRYKGEDIRRGDVALAAGTELGPAQLGVLASIAHAAPLVHRPPLVAFMGSGDEIVDLDHAAEILAGTKIATSNSYTLFGMIRRA